MAVGLANRTRLGRGLYIKPYMLMRRFLILSCLVLVVTSGDLCSAKDLSWSQTIGVRFGLWNSTEAKHVQPDPGEDILTKVTAPYGEIHVSLGLKKGFAVGISLGSCFRGETRYNDPYGYYWKRITVYPITAELKYYPLHRVAKSKWQPYLDGGGGLVSGTENIRIGEYIGSLVLSSSGTNSYLTFGWHGGAGMDFILTNSLVLGFDFRYRGVRFGDDVGGIKNYSGPEATLGVSYIVKGL